MKTKRLAIAPPRVGTADSRRLKPPEKQRDPVYGTPKHRAWRATVIARSGGRCQHCGRVNCRLFADHIHELRDGGAPLDPTNGEALCGSCHSAKTAAARARRMAG